MHCCVLLGAFECNQGLVVPGKKCYLRIENLTGVMALRSDCFISGTLFW